jgi:hypothetical protein
VEAPDARVLINCRRDQHKPEADISLGGEGASSKTIVPNPKCFMSIKVLSLQQAELYPFSIKAETLHLS